MLSCLLLIVYMYKLKLIEIGFNLFNRNVINLFIMKILHVHNVMITNLYKMQNRKHFYKYRLCVISMGQVLADLMKIYLNLMVFNRQNILCLGES